ncbi:Rieske 2Fe-2S domain-containing protein, partial [Wenyingzhuangia sp. 1_MG-2023]|nr:Rieske 2Fe-2S domain-containing protein [Wenyingzhuangia sp. 1_MG-2023]
WYPVLPSDQLTADKPVSLRILGYKIALWRDTDNTAHAVEDHCPHRGAPLSLGANLGDRLQCPYHGVEVDCSGKVRKVPGSPGCKLEGSRPTRRFHTQEVAGAIFLYNAVDPQLETPPELILPEQLTSDEYSSFLCY